MHNENNQRLQIYLKDQLALGGFRTRAFVYDDQNKKNPERDLFVQIKTYTEAFLEGDTTNRFVIVPGLRGTGKTTLLAQIYHSIGISDRQKLFLSVDQVTQTFGTTLQDALEAYEQLLGVPFEKMQEPAFIFLDEVQYDSKWAILLKTIYDRSHKVFFLVTGSSALMLNMNADVTRRAVSHSLLPMSFSEYARIKHGKVAHEELSLAIQEALFRSKNAEEVFERLHALQGQATKYWLGLDGREITHYMSYGTLPYMVALNNEAFIYDQIKKTLDRVIGTDIPQIGKFRNRAADKFPILLYAMADTDVLSTYEMSKTLGVSRPTVIRMLDILEQTELVTKVLPYSSHRGQSRKPAKYIFSSPAFRGMYFRFIGSTKPEEDAEGRLIEDTVGLLLRRVIGNHPVSSVTYDTQKGGADFVVTYGHRKIVLETGRGKKDFTQTLRTLARTKATYGLVISKTELGLHTEKNAVSVPFELFLLA